MIVTCPVCSTRYLVDPRALGAAGRRVRCANCAHTWYQNPPEDAPRRIDLLAAEPAVATQPSGRVQLPALSQPRRRSPSVLPLLAVLVLVAALGAGLWVARDEVVGYWPEAERYYDLLGIPVASTQLPLKLDQMTTTRDVEDGLPTLVIQGQVVNVSKVARDVPKLKVILEDSDKHELHSWSFSVTDERLLPGASVSFRTSIAQPSEAATNVVVTFDTGS